MRAITSKKRGMPAVCSLASSPGEVMADYVAGPSHVMPTGGSARFSSALSARDFVRVTPFLDMDEETFAAISEAASDLARLEMLEAHARALRHPPSVVALQSRFTNLGKTPMRDLRTMMRPHLYNPTGYVGAQHSDHLATSAGIDPADVIRLNANENPYDPLPEITDALVGLPIHEYPDQDLVRMRTALSEYTGRPMSQVIAGSGGDEIIELLTKLFVAPGRSDDRLSADFRHVRVLRTDLGSRIDTGRAKGRLATGH